MNNKFNLEIKGFGLINKANIEINKINVVGGVNSSGKSTASKILYCFLKANSSDIKDYVLAAILPTINKFINIMEHPDPNANVNLPGKYTVEDDIKTILRNYSSAVKIFKGLNKENFFIIPDEILYDMKRKIDKFIPILTDKKNTKVYSSVVQSLFENESLLNFKGQSTFSNDSFKSLVSYEYNDRERYWSMMERYFELSLKGYLKEDLDDFDENFIYLTEGSFDFLNKIFYIDSISYLDLNYYLNSNYKTKKVFGYKEHIEYILNVLKNYNNINEENLSDDIKEKCNLINNAISEIIQGHIYKLPEDLELLDDFNYYYVPNSPIKQQYDVNVSSGIQQISIIQMLLDKYLLCPGSFLIIDEPEVNLHPEWQFKFAEILVLLTKELDITLYLNSHSPMFIESIDAFCEYYDMEDYINYYLTEESGNEGKYNFTKIESDELYKLYSNLGNPYHLIDQLRLKKQLGE